jgi:RNA polymerase sigma-70 factor (ECF subfamily)
MQDHQDDRHTDYLKRFMSAQPALRAYVLSVVRDFHVAEDVVQQVALAAWERFEQYDAKRPFEAWVMGIARNKCTDAFRDRGRTPVLPDDVLTQLMEDAAVVASEVTERQKALAECLGRLSRNARSVIRMRFAQNLGADEIAERLRRSVAAVRKALTRARAFLVQCTAKVLEGGTAQ